MNFDFPLFLICLTGATGFIALVDRLYFQVRRSPNTNMPWIAKESRGLFPVFLFVLLLRSFVFQPFRVPTGSLEPTVMPGDFIAVNMASYGLRLPVWHQKILSTGHPHTGDVMLFRWPVNPKIDFVKRVVGVPGDRISYIDKVFYINGQRAPQHYLGEAIDYESATPRHVKVFEENLRGVKHKIFIDPTQPRQDFRDLVVPANHYFTIGDNRDNSDDSRFWGFVPETAIIGKALLVWLNLNFTSHQPLINWQRIGTKLTP